ncbi:MAG: hypothetical protein R3266_15360, partial [Gemmatimonadota bacterium]|nr:hypothetical protein [Gemmatimonadota bacterium]
IRDGTAERLNSPPVGRALSEHVLHSEPASAPPLGGLLRLLDALERVREEPARRIGIYASSYRSAGVDPYRVEASEVYGLLSSGSSAIRDNWERLFGFPDEDFDEFVAEGWASTHVDPDDPGEQEPAMLVPHLHAIMPDGHCPSLEASCLGLAGRLGAWTDDPAGFVADVADWIDVSRELVPPGRSGCGGLLAGVEALIVAGAHAGRDGERIENTARVLARSGGEILQMIKAFSTRTWPLRSWLSRDDDLPVAAALAKSSAIDPEDASLLARHRFLGSYATALSGRPEAADLALRSLRGLARRADSIRRPPILLHLRRLGREAAELATTPDRALAERSCGWLLHQVEHREPADLAWLTEVTGGLTRFLREAEGHPLAGEEPVDFGRFLHEHWSLWERLVEASRASMPRTPNPYVLSDAAYVYLWTLFWGWERGGHTDPIAEALLRDGDWRERLAAWERHAWEPLRFAVRMAGGEVEGLRSLMAHDGHRFWQGLEAGRPLAAERLWSVLEDDDELLPTVRDAAVLPELTTELLDAL